MDNIRNTHTNKILWIAFAALLIILPPALPKAAAIESEPFELSSQNAPASPSDCDDDLLCLEIVRKSMIKCWEMANNGMLDTEHGFVLIKEECVYNVVFSQNFNFYRRARVPVPKGSIAIFHTHPHNLSPKPSRGDEEQACRVRIPICTITNHGVYCYFPDSDKTIKLRDFPEWTKSCNNGSSHSNPSFRPMD